MERTRVTYNGIPFLRYNCTRCSGTMVPDLEMMEARICLKCILCGQEFELKDSEIRRYKGLKRQQFSFKTTRKLAKKQDKPE